MNESLIIAVIVSGGFLALFGLGKFIRWYLSLAVRFREKAMIQTQPFGPDDAMAVSLVKCALKTNHCDAANVVEWLLEVWEPLCPNAKSLIQEAVEEAFTLDDVYLSWPRYKPECYRFEKETWSRVRRLWQQDEVTQ